jgi:hypothetical protein
MGLIIAIIHELQVIYSLTHIQKLIALIQLYQYTHFPQVHVLFHIT